MEPQIRYCTTDHGVSVVVAAGPAPGPQASAIP
jgi:hypothetical protein